MLTANQMRSYLSHHALLRPCLPVLSLHMRCRFWSRAIFYEWSRQPRGRGRRSRTTRKRRLRSLRRHLCLEQDLEYLGWLGYYCWWHHLQQVSQVYGLVPAAQVSWLESAMAHQHLLVLIDLQPDSRLVGIPWSPCDNVVHTECYLGSSGQVLFGYTRYWFGRAQHNTFRRITSPSANFRSLLDFQKCPNSRSKSNIQSGFQTSTYHLVLLSNIYHCFPILRARHSQPPRHNSNWRSTFWDHACRGDLDVLHWKGEPTGPNRCSVRTERKLMGRRRLSFIVHPKTGLHRSRILLQLCSNRISYWSSS